MLHQTLEQRTMAYFQDHGAFLPSNAPVESSDKRTWTSGSPSGPPQYLQQSSHVYVTEAVAYLFRVAINDQPWDTGLSS